MVYISVFPFFLQYMHPSAPSHCLSLKKQTATSPFDFHKYSIAHMLFQGPDLEKESQRHYSKGKSKTYPSSKPHVPFPVSEGTGFSGGNLPPSPHNPPKSPQYRAQRPHQDASVHLPRALSSKEQLRPQKKI